MTKDYLIKNYGYLKGLELFKEWMELSAEFIELENCYLNNIVYSRIGYLPDIRDVEIGREPLLDFKNKYNIEDDRIIGNYIKKEDGSNKKIEIKNGDIILSESTLNKDNTMPYKQQELAKLINKYKIDRNDILSRGVMGHTEYEPKEGRLDATNFVVLKTKRGELHIYHWNTVHCKWFLVYIEK